MKHPKKKLRTIHKEIKKARFKEAQKKMLEESNKEKITQ